MSAIAIKPHHFVDILRTVGGGTFVFPPHPYGHDLHRVAAALLADRQITLVVELGADAVCGPCQHNVRGVCDDSIDTSFRPAAPPRKQDWNLLIDRRWCGLLGVAAGDQVPACQFCGLLHGQLGALAQVYRELPPSRIATRTTELRRGIAWYLREDAGHGPARAAGGTVGGGPRHAN